MYIFIYQMKEQNIYMLFHVNVEFQKLLSYK